MGKQINQPATWYNMTQQMKSEEVRDKQSYVLITGVEYLSKTTGVFVLGFVCCFFFSPCLRPQTLLEIVFKTKKA